MPRDSSPCPPPPDPARQPCASLRFLPPQETNYQHLKWFQEYRWFGRMVGGRWPRKMHRCNRIAPNSCAWPSEALRCGTPGAGSGAQGAVSVGDWLASHLAGDPAVVCAALPEAPAVACDVSDHLVLIGEIHFPDQRPVAENPHLSSAPLPQRLSTAPCACAGGDCTLPDASNRQLRRTVGTSPFWWRKAHWDM